MAEKPEFDTNIGLNRAPEREMNINPPETGRVLTIATIVMIAALLIGGMVALAPDIKSKVITAETQPAPTLVAEEKPTETAPPSQPSWQSLLPADAKQKLDDMSAEVKNLTEQAENMKQAVTDLQSGSMPERLAKLETHMTQFVGTEHQAALSAMFDKVKMMGQSQTGQQSIDAAMTALLGAIQSGDATGQTDPTKAILDAKAVNPDVAKTLDDVAPEDVQAATMLLALTQMRQSLGRNNDSFDTDLALLKQTLAKDNPELQTAIDRLAPQAKIGVLTPSGLSNELKSMTGEIVEASLTGQNVSVEDKVKARLNDLIRVEKNGVPVTGNETQLTIDAAQKMLDKGDVAGAVKTLETIDGAAGAKTAPLIDQANATLAAQQLQSLLGQNMVGQLQNSIRQMQQTGTINTQGLQNIIAEIERMVPAHMPQR